MEYKFRLRSIIQAFTLTSAPILDEFKFKSIDPENRLVTEKQAFVQYYNSAQAQLDAAYDALKRLMQIQDAKDEDFLDLSREHDSSQGELRSYYDEAINRWKKLIEEYPDLA